MRAVVKFMGWVGWQASLTLSSRFLGAPQGWSFCGIVGLTSAVIPGAKLAEKVMDRVFFDPGHCYRAMKHSIGRQGSTRAYAERKF